MVRTVNIYEAKTHLSKLVAEAEAGAEIVIARNNRPVALLTAVPMQRSVRVPGALRGRVRIAADFDTFDAADDAAWYGA